MMLVRQGAIGLGHHVESWNSIIRASEADWLAGRQDGADTWTFQLPRATGSYGSFMKEWSSAESRGLLKPSILTSCKGLDGLRYSRGTG